MTRTLFRYVNWLCDSYTASPRYLAVLRIAVGAYLLLLPVNLTWPGRVPEPYFHPRPGPGLLLEAPPSLEFLQGLQLVHLVLAALLLLGYRTVRVSALVTLTLLVGAGVANSYGKVDHLILFDLLPLAMGLAGWGSAWSLDSRFRQPVRPASGLAVAGYGLVVAFAMLTAAVPKAVQGWLDPSRQATRGYLAQYVERGDAGPLAGLLLAVDSNVFWKLLDYSTVALEGGLVVAVFVPPLFRFALLALIGFHVGVYLSLGITFHTHAFVYYPFLYGLVVVAARYVSPGSTRRLSPVLRRPRGIG